MWLSFSAMIVVFRSRYWTPSGFPLVWRGQKSSKTKNWGQFTLIRQERTFISDKPRCWGFQGVLSYFTEAHLFTQVHPLNFGLLSFLKLFFHLFYILLSLLLAFSKQFTREIFDDTSGFLWVQTPQQRFPCPAVWRKGCMLHILRNCCPHMAFSLWEL